jgi:hypothetical protein
VLGVGFAGDAAPVVVVGATDPAEFAGDPPHPANIAPSEQSVIHRNRFRIALTINTYRCSPIRSKQGYTLADQLFSFLGNFWRAHDRFRGDARTKRMRP